MQFTGSPSALLGVVGGVMAHAERIAVGVVGAEQPARQQVLERTDSSGDPLVEVDARPVADQRA